MYCGDEVSAIVGDIGYSNARFGFAGEDVPKALFPGQVGRILTDGNPSSWALSDPELAKLRPGLAMTHAVGAVDGAIADWDAVERLWARAFQWLNVSVPNLDKQKTNKKAREGGSESQTVKEEEGGGAGDDDDDSANYHSAHAGGHSVLCGEGAGASRHQRMKTMELLFETFESPALFLAPNPVLAAFAAGRQTALVVDCGGGGTSVTPVLDGYALRKPIQRSARGGQWISNEVLRLLESSVLHRSVHPRQEVLSRARGAASAASEVVGASGGVVGGVGGVKRSADGSSVVVDATAAEAAAVYLPFPATTHQSFVNRCRLEVATTVKEDMCGLPLVPGMSDAGLAPYLPVGGMPTSCELPDGTAVSLSPELYRVPELLFQDSRKEGGHDADSPNGATLACTPSSPPHAALHKMVHASLTACDPDLRKELASTILLTGAGSQFKYFPERLQREVASTLPAANFKAKVVCPEPIERRFGVWIGGSILASLGSFQQMWLTKAQYEDLGAVRAEKRFSES